MGNNQWKLFLDDLRMPGDKYQDGEEWVIARSSEAAKTLVQEAGLPRLISLDHDLGGQDTAMVFLNWLAYEHWNGKEDIPDYLVHSSNPVGAKNIRAFMDSWKRSLDL